MAVDPYLAVRVAPGGLPGPLGGGTHPPSPPPARGPPPPQSHPPGAHRPTGEGNWPAPRPASRDPPGRLGAPSRFGRPLPWSHPPWSHPPARGPPPPRAATPTVRRQGGPQEKSRLPSPAAPRTSRSRPANWSRTRPMRAARPPARAPTAGGHRGTLGPPGAPSPHTPGASPHAGAPTPPAPAHWPTGCGQGQKEKTRRTGNIPRGVSCAAPGGAGAAGLFPPGSRPPSKRPALPDPLMGGCLYAQI